MNTGEVLKEDKEQVEGDDIAIDLSLGDYPIDTLLIRNEARTVHDVVRRIEQGGYNMNPDFQRDFLWDLNKQSKLIESILMRIPLPVFYLAEDEQGRMIVVDGLQRLSTFKHFLNNDFKLKLPEQEELNNKLFEELPPKLQNRIEDCNLVLYILDSKVPEQAKLDIFERVNGGVALTRQQMRNCLYMGKATEFLKKEASKQFFKDATGKSLKTLTMKDREMVNRFCAFQLLSLDDYKGDMDSFLAMALKKMNKLSDDDILELSSEFTVTLDNNYNVFGKHAFRKHWGSDGKRSLLNASLWDVMSTGLSRYPIELVNKRKDELRTAFYSLMNDEYFMDSITYGTSDLRRVALRFELSNRMFTEVFDADQARS